MNILKNARRIFSSSPASGSESVLGYKIYTAIISQTGTSVPTVTIINNTLGETPTWYYDFYSEGVGRYQGRFVSSILTENKTVVFFSNMKQQSAASAPNSVYINVYETSVQTGLFDEIAISTLNGTGAYANGILSYTSIEIRVYP